MPSGALHCPADGTALPVGPEARVGLVVHGRYRLERFVGRGRHGDVYFARHVTVGRTLAIKALRRELTTDKTAVARFIQEAQSVAALGHPNVVEVTDAGELPDRTPYLVMEWLEGESLAMHVRRVGALPPTRAAEIVAAIASGLEACHAIGVIHRDLKPDNIILSRTIKGEVPKVVDFGLARVTTSDKKLTTHGAVVGDFRYAAPEQLTGDAIDARVDIHALGCVFFELVVGRPPQRGEPMAPALGSFAPVAATAFAFSREARYPTMAALRNALAEAANGTSATFAPIHATPVVAPKAKRTWLLPVVFASLAVLMTLVAVLAVVVIKRDDDRTIASSDEFVAAPAPVPQAAPPVIASGNVRIEAESGALEVRVGDRVLGTTPLSITRPSGDESLTITLVSEGRVVESVVLDARSPEVVRVSAATPTPAPAPTPGSHGGARPQNTGAPAEAPAPAPTQMFAAPPIDMIDPWQ